MTSNVRIVGVLIIDLKPHVALAARAGRDQAALARVRHLHRPVGVVAAAEAGIAPDCAACRRAWPCQTYTAVTHETDTP
jgi:hypothetical protein